MEEFQKPIPPPAPKTIEGFAQEMLGVLANGPEVYQGMLHYWLMWRLPQIYETIKYSNGLNFYYLTNDIENLYSDFNKLSVISDLVVVGQCGQLLNHEILTHFHGLDRPWPEVDPKYANEGLWATAVTAARPINDDLVPFIQYFFQPFADSGRVLFLPLSTMLAPSKNDLNSPQSILSGAIKNSSSEGLPTRIAVVKDNKSSDKTKKVEEPKMGYRNGRLISENAKINIIDKSWTYNELLNFDLYMASLFNLMPIISGNLTNQLSQPSHEFNIRIPYLEGIAPDLLSNAIKQNPEEFINFRYTINTALTEAFKLKGSENFTARIKQIQKEIIDDGISKLDKEWKKLRKMRFARYGIYASGALGLSAGIYTNTSFMNMVPLISFLGANFFNELEKKFSNSKLKDENMHFVWRLKK